jgi:hypothetical protein
LGPKVLEEKRGLGAKGGIGVENRAGESPIKLHVKLCGVDLTQEHLAMSPCELKNAIGQVTILVLPDQPGADIPAFSRTGNHIDGCRCRGI